MSLLSELQAAGLPVVSATDLPNKPRQATFSRALTDDEDVVYRNILFPSRQDEIARQQGAKTFAKNIPNWSTWSQAQLQSWWDANLADSIVDGFAIPAGVKAMLKAQNAAILRIAQLEIALRDQIWPDLPE